MNTKSFLITAALMVVGCAVLAGEVTNELRLVSVKMMCDTPKCSGEMKWLGRALASNPPQLPHECTVCKTNRIFRAIYPDVRTVEVGQQK